jgi:hypothetical protein
MHFLPRNGLGTKASESAKNFVESAKNGRRFGGGFACVKQIKHPNSIQMTYFELKQRHSLEIFWPIRGVAQARQFFFLLVFLTLPLDCLLRVDDQLLLQMTDSLGQAFPC